MICRRMISKLLIFNLNTVTETSKCHRCVSGLPDRAIGFFVFLGLVRAQCTRLADGSYAIIRGSNETKGNN